MSIFRFICVLALLGSFGLSVSAQSQDPPDPSELKLRIVKRDYDDVSDINRWEIKAAYPEVRLEGDKPSGVFNAEAKATVMKEVARFKKDMAEAAADGNLPEGMSFYQSIEYSEEYLDEDVVSVKFFQSEYTGGAHPNHWTYTLNYDLSKDKKIELPDLFKPGSGYLKIISENSIASILRTMGDDSGSDWVRTGAGPDLKNFSSWNITKNGLLFTFDPYQVGPYAVGSFEAIIPYNRFSPETQGAAFHLAESASYIDGSPPNFCRGGRWTMLDTEYKLASVKGGKNTRAYFYDDANDCPDGTNCRRKAYLIAGDEVIVQREFGDYSCVWYQPSKGEETVGWLKTDAIATRVDASKPPRNWIGEWGYASNFITIKESPSGKLHVYGTAIWQGMGDNVHVGEIDYLESPNLDLLKAGDGEDKYDCRVRLRRLGKYMIVDDNLMCGGANVTFNGVYLKK